MNRASLLPSVNRCGASRGRKAIFFSPDAACAKVSSNTEPQSAGLAFSRCGYHDHLMHVVGRRLLPKASAFPSSSSSGSDHGTDAVSASGKAWSQPFDLLPFVRDNPIAGKRYKNNNRVSAGGWNCPANDNVRLRIFAHSTVFRHRPLSGFRTLIERNARYTQQGQTPEDPENGNE